MNKLMTFEEWWNKNKYENSPFYWSRTSSVAHELEKTWFACEAQMKAHYDDKIKELEKAYFDSSEYADALKEELQLERECVNFYALLDFTGVNARDRQKNRKEVL